MQDYEIFHHGFFADLEEYTTDEAIRVPPKKRKSLIDTNQQEADAPSLRRLGNSGDAGSCMLPHSSRYSLQMTGAMLGDTDACEKVLR